MYYFYQHRASVGFQDGAMGNLFATILGAVTGIPIALEINRRQQSAQSEAHEASLKFEESSRKQKVLSLIRKELDQNKTAIIRRRGPIETGGKRSVETHPLRDELWIAFSDSGELKHVDNPDILSALSNAYHHIRANIHLERSFMNAALFPGLRVVQTKTTEDTILEYITTVDAELLAALNQAISSVDSAL